MSPTNLSATRSGIAGLVLGLLLWSGVVRAQGAPPAGSAPPPPLPPASSTPGGAPPPYMYQEPWTPPPGSTPPPGGQARPGPPSNEPPPASPPVYRPPPPPPYGAPYPAPYVYEPPPPPPTYHRAPLSALWVGARLGALFPFGSAYDVGYDLSGYYSIGESWSGLASGGPAVEADVGARLARRYIVYVFWEHAFMGTGGDPAWNTSPPINGVSAFGAQTSATTDFPGLGFRWSSRPDSVGFLIDIGFGYRWFREKWASGATMTLQGFGELRAGFGADIRVNRLFSIEPLFSFSTGSFQDRNYAPPGQAERPVPSYTGSHGTVTFTLGGHFDLAPSY